MSEHAKGLLITVLGVLILTPDVMMVRLIDTDIWTMNFWRGVLQAVAVAIGYAVFFRANILTVFLKSGRGGMAVALFYCVSTLCFIFSLSHTLAANTLIFVSVAPLFGAIMSRIFLKERVLPATWIAIVAAMAGITIVVADGLGSGNTLGNVVGLGTALAMASIFTVSRHHKHVSMVPAYAVGCLASAFVSLPLTGVFVLSGDQIWLMGLLGLAILPVSFALITTGPRYIPAPEVSLIMLMETVIGPFWLWLALGEQPSDLTVIGGVIVVGTLFVHSLYRLSRRKKVAATA